MEKHITREQVERVARIYKNNKDAGIALGIAMRSFARLCRKYDIETPYARKQRRYSQFRRSMVEALD
jgi:hypothetical protein